MLLINLKVLRQVLLLPRTEGIIPAPETTHAIAQVVREAKLAREEGKAKTIVFNFSGHGLVDMAAYDQYFSGKLEDYSISDEEIRKNLEGLPQMGQPEGVLVN